MTSTDPDDVASPPSRWSRRTLILAGAAGLAVGAAATETTNLLTQTGARLSPVTPPGETLMYEHGVLKRVLLIYDNALSRAATDPHLAATAIQRGAEIIHDFIENFHEALEEGYVFPVLKAAGSNVATIDTLLLQHARGRLITQLLLAQVTPQTLTVDSSRQRLTSAVSAFVRMYQPHEAREDTVIFPAFRAALTPLQLERCGATFTHLQTQQFGRDGFATIVTNVVSIEESLGIYNLSEFTPAAVAPTAIP